MERVQQQIRENYEKAFFNLLKEKVASDPPDYDWLIRLYTEIRDKLCKLVKKDCVYEKRYGRKVRSRILRTINKT